MPDNCYSIVEEYLPEAFIKDRFITEEDQRMDYSYEDYLREMLNCSGWFMEKTHGEEFRKPDSEAHGENDALSNVYELDFKCILSSSIQRARDATSPQISVNKDKTTVYFRGSKKQGKFEGHKLHAILKNLTFDEFEQFANEKAKIKEMTDRDKDLSYLSKTVNKKKNLFLYYPALLSFPQNDGDVFNAADTIYNSYEIVFRYRRKRLTEFDTYLAFYYEGDLCILNCKEEEPELIDRINPLKTSNTFMQLYQIHDPFIMHPVLKRFEKFLLMEKEKDNVSLG